MNIIERGRSWLQGLRGMAQRTPWEERRCPFCGQHETWKHGTYTRRPWTLTGRRPLRMQRYWCRRCRRTFVPPAAQAGRGRWYGRDVQRCVLDSWLHTGSSLRRTAEWVRSWLGQQERWHLWCPLAPARPVGRHCRLGASTVQRWLDEAGQRAQQTVEGQWAGVPTSGQVGTDGLWAKLRGGVKQVVLVLTDSVTGMVYPPAVVPDEDGPAPWDRLFRQAARAGLRLGAVRGVTSDGTRGLATYLEQTLVWVHHQRCVFHIWRNLATPLGEAARAAAAGLRGAAATAVRTATRRGLLPLVHAVLDAADDAAAVAALKVLAAHPCGAEVATALRNDVEAVLVYRGTVNQGLRRVGPEWKWRDFRLRLSRGRNHQTGVRLERAALVWAIYHNFTPAQWRSERKRTYRRPGRSPLALAGVPPGDVSYLDALAV
jgi:transposase-like protein